MPVPVANWCFDQILNHSKDEPPLTKERMASNLQTAICTAFEIIDLYKRSEDSWEYLALTTMTLSRRYQFRKFIHDKAIECPRQQQLLADKRIKLQLPFCRPLAAS